MAAFSFLRRLSGRRLCVLILLGLSVLRAAAAPDWVLSGRVPELENVVLAETPHGRITSLDVLMFDEMTSQVLWDVPIEAFLDPSSLAAERNRELIQGAIDRLAVMRVLADQAGDWMPAEDLLRVRSHAAAEAVWIEEVVRPSVRVLPADIDRYYLEHATDYLRRRQVQIRYIFKRVDPDDEAAVAEARAELDAIAQAVRAGNESFEYFARTASDAHSGLQGGLLPPFYEGTYDATIEQRAFAMSEPGELSAPFVGPGGLYLLQLVRAYPPRNITRDEVAGEIAAQLRSDHIRHYYAYELQQLRDRADHRDFSAWFAYLDADAPMAMVGKRRLERQDFIRFYGSPITEDLEIIWDVVVGGVASWIEGEIVMDELGPELANLHRWVRRARELATAVERARHTLVLQVPEASHATAAAARRTLAEAQQRSDFYRAYRLVMFQIAPETDPTMGAAVERRAERTAQWLESQLRAGIVLNEPSVIELETWHAKLAAADDDRVEDQVRELNNSFVAPYPNISMHATALDWIAPMPNSPMARLLEGTPVGRLSRTQRIGSLRRVFLVLRSEPADIDKLADNPVLLRSLAFEAGARDLIEATRQRLHDEGAIVYTFQVEP